MIPLACRAGREAHLATGSFGSLLGISDAPLRGVRFVDPTSMSYTYTEGAVTTLALVAQPLVVPSFLGGMPRVYVRAESHRGF